MSRNQSGKGRARLRELGRRLLGWARMVVWGVLLLAVHAPWTDLGGLAGERTRWLERALVGAGLIAGATAGGYARETCVPYGRWSHARWMRWLVLPPAALVALALVVLEVRGHRYLGLAIWNALIAWNAGVDTALAGLPLARGWRYRFSGAIEAPPEEAAAARAAF